jgi:hypothetical protein
LHRRRRTRSQYVARPCPSRAGGEAAGARDQFAAMLLIVERVLGPGQLNTLTTRDRLA